jgi:hypothetical protein
VISNQAVVTAVAAEPADRRRWQSGEWPEPTVVVVGAGQQLSISKQVTVVGGGAAVPGAQLEYVVRVVNIAAVPASTSSSPTTSMHRNRPACLRERIRDHERIGDGRHVRRFDHHRRLRRVSGPLPPGGSWCSGSGPLSTQPCARHGGHEHRRGRLEQPTQTASASVSIVVGRLPRLLRAERVSLA